MTQNNFNELVEKYINKHGVSGWNLETSNDAKYNNIIVVPAIQEYENIKYLLGSLIENDSSFFIETLLIIVINNTLKSSVEIKADNEKSIILLREIIQKKSEDELVKKILSAGLNVGIVDASSAGKELPDKDGGVGLARKIGMDLALLQLDYSNDKKKLLVCLDADCTVERNFLSSIVTTFNKKYYSAAYVQYEHILPESEDEKKAIICYEIFLRYYVLGIKYANSPFAFPTIGSTMICDAECYIKIGGMNKKKAAEDFYFMEKLVKVTSVNKIDSTKVFPSSRGSWRVPFGTGQRINRYLAGTHHEYLLYEPASFDVLKDWLKEFHTEENLSAEEYLEKAESIHKDLHKFLIQNNFEKDWDSILKGSKSSGQIEKQKIIWFDGFRTLKLIHFLRDNSLPLIGMFDALDLMLNKIGYSSNIARTTSIPDVKIQIKYLNVLRSLT